MRKFAFLEALRWRALRRIITLHGNAIRLRCWALAQKAGYEIHARRVFLEKIHKYYQYKFLSHVAAGESHINGNVHGGMS